MESSERDEEEMSRNTNSNSNSNSNSASVTVTGPTGVTGPRVINIKFGYKEFTVKGQR